MLTERQESLLVLIHYQTQFGTFYPLDSVFAEELDELYNKGMLRKNGLGYALTIRGEEVVKDVETD